MSYNSVMYGLLTNALMGILFHGINTFIQVAKDERTLFYGIIALTATTIVAIYAFAWKWNTVRTWSFYLVFLPIFMTSSFDVLASIDSWKSPNGFFVNFFLETPDPHIHNVVMTVFAFLDGTILQSINLTVLYRLSSGLSARSLLLLPAISLGLMMSVYTFCILTSGIPLHPLTLSSPPSSVLYVVLLPLGVLKMPRSFSLSQKKGAGGKSTLLKVFTLPLLLAAGTVVGAKALVLSGVRNEYLDIVRLNDPLIFLNDIEKTTPFISAVIWHYVLVCLPLLAISFVYHFKPTKPTFLWEVAVANFALICTGQVFFIGGPFYWKTPANLRVSPWNGTFWIINLIPVAAAAIQVVSLLPYRSSLQSVKAKNKKTK